MKLNEKIKNMSEKNKKVFFLSVIVISVLFILGVTGLTYAWFNATVSGNSAAKGAVVETGILSIKYTNGNEIKGENILPGWTVAKTFTVENTGTVAATYKINWENITNTFVNKSDLIYKLTSTNSGGSLSETQIPNTGEHVNILNNITIPAGVIQTYTLTITYKNRNADQSSDMGKKLLGKIEVLDVNEGNLFPFTWNVNDAEDTETESKVIFEYTKGIDNIDDMALEVVKDADNTNYKISNNTYHNYGLEYEIDFSENCPINFGQHDASGKFLRVPGEMNVVFSAQVSNFPITVKSVEEEYEAYPPDPITWPGTITRGFWVADLFGAFFTNYQCVEYYKIWTSDTLNIGNVDCIEISSTPFDIDELIGKTLTLSGVMDGEAVTESNVIDESMISEDEGFIILADFIILTSNGVYITLEMIEAGVEEITIQ